MVTTPQRHPRRPQSPSVPTRWNPSIIVQLLAVLAIAILVAVATVVRQHAALPSSSSRTRGAARNTAPLNRRTSSNKDKRLHGEITALENELKSLANEYMEVTNEITRLKSGEEMKEKERIDKMPLKDNKIDKAHGNERIQAFERKYGVKGKDKRGQRQEVPLTERVSQLMEGEGRREAQPALVPPLEIPETDDSQSDDNAAKKKEREPKKWWVRKEIFATPDVSWLEHAGRLVQANNDGANNDDDDTPGAVIPHDLSVNHLQRIARPYAELISNAVGRMEPTDGPLSEPDDFLPVVTTNDIDLRWRSKARPGSRREDMEKTTAYRIVARRSRHHSPSSEGENENDEDDPARIIWDSGKVDVSDGLPDVVSTKDTPLQKLNAGSIVEWRVTVWDSHKSSSGGGRPSTSSWTKFAVGPTNDEWQGRWISHPIDLQSWNDTDAGAFWTNKKEDQEVACKNWERRGHLPLFRAKLPSILGDEEDDEIESALLVVSGLGSFRASLDGVPLSSSGPLDPPLTDFAQRVSYRGYDVTKFLTGKEGASGSTEHVVGISVGSGWWDHRPIAGSFIRLFYFPHGAVTCIAQLYVTYKKSGETKVLLPTGDDSSGWQVAKGHIRESSLFTGEYTDLQSLASFKHWDTALGWAEIADKESTDDIHAWVEPKVYKSDTTIESLRLSLHMKSNAKIPNARKGQIIPRHKLAPIGRLIPHEIPPVLPIERLAPDEVYSLGNGRWMFDFGKGVSGMIRFEDGLPQPIVPHDGEYPRGHTVSTLGPDESFITVVYGDSLEVTTGDINIAVVAGMGLHDGGPRHKSKPAHNAELKGGPCYPKDHVEAGSLLQRDVYILPKSGHQQSVVGSFADARQSHFTTHAFRFAEVCCSSEPPTGVHALAYRTAFKKWGTFSSSNIRINGGYELVKNAMNSNILGVQSDCPHREKIQYGGDIIADSPASLHFYDMSAFYRKVVWDWGDQQWDNGAYAGTSHWLALNDYAGIGTGSGETVWASAPIVMTARHMQHYGDSKLLEESYDNHKRWFNFLREHFDKGMKKKGYDEELKGYVKEGSGLGDWLTFRGRDTWLTHQSFYMATARCIAYIASKLGREEDEVDEALQLAESVKDRIARLYLHRDNSFLPPESGAAQLSPGPEMSLYSRVVPGEKRCSVLRRYFERQGHTWPGGDETRFVKAMSPSTLKEMIASGEVTKRGTEWAMGWSQWHGFNEGIFAVRYALKTLSDNGKHNIALAKANGFGVGTFEYQLSHNATTHWESWWRSEDLYSHNHPMLGATAEWMVAAVAGVSLHPMTTGGKDVLFWPRFPNSARTIDSAGATQGTRRGDFSIAWKFEDLPQEEEEDSYDSAIVKIHVRLFVPPDGHAVFRLPEYSNGEGVDSIIKYATQLPDIETVKSLSTEACESRRKAKMGFNYNWEYDRGENTWVKVHRKKSIGTSCQSYLFHSSLEDVVAWSPPEAVPGSSDNGLEVELGPGLYDVLVDKWQLKPEVKGTKEWRIASIDKIYESEDIGPYCSDSDTFDWSIGDASYLI